MLFRECIDIANMELQTLHFIKTEQKVDKTRQARFCKIIYYNTESLCRYKYFEPGGTFMP